MVITRKLLPICASGLLLAQSCPASISKAAVPRDKAAAPEPLPRVLTLKAAEDYALANHPDIKRAELLAGAANQVVTEARSGLLPQLTGNAVFAESENDNSRLAAPPVGLSNSTVISRESNGLYLTQLITDFGKTALLTSSSRFSAKSAKEQIEAVRAAVLLNVDRAYFAALGARSMEELTGKEVSTNNLLFERVEALAGANLKSSLDVSLQAANLARARLLQVQAQGREQEAMSDLGAAMGLKGGADFNLPDVQEDTAPPASVEPLIAEAIMLRPDLISTRYDRDAALKFAASRGAARLGSVQGIAAGGLSPYKQDGLSGNYGMFGVNFSLPLFTGGRLSAEQKEAQLRAQAYEQYLENQEVLAMRDVRTAWIDVHTAYSGIQVSKDFLDASSTAFELAQNLYIAGTSSIVEVSQAELQKMEAEMDYVTARYDYQTKLSVLSYQTGQLK